MEERRSWLPAGLEGPSPEPDDRASHRSEKDRGKRSDRGPTGAGGQGADDRKPPPQRGRSAAGSGESQKPKAPKAEKRRWKSVDVEDEGPKAKGKERPDEVRSNGRGNGAPPRSADERAETRGDRQGRSNTDAMGQDKYRKVVGQRYGLGRTRQFLFYGIFVAVVVPAYTRLQAAADSLDKAPAHDKDQAPWSKPGAPQGPLGGFAPSKPGDKGHPTHFQ